MAKVTVFGAIKGSRELCVERVDFVRWTKAGGWAVVAAAVVAIARAELTAELTAGERRDVIAS